MKYISVCSGVEAATQAWESLGWTPIAFSEIEPFPCAVLASRFPNVPNLGDMSKITYDHERNILSNGTTRIVCDGGIDLLVGGTPCQSFSVAGQRKGLEGASGLAAHYARLIGEIRPRWFVWENVPGALSSVTYGDQRDFNFLLHAFAVGGDASLGLRYDCEWRVVDTQYVRVEQFPRAIPQRRRRVFIVGHLATDGGSRCQVLLEQEGLRGDTAPCRVKGKGFARNPSSGIGGAGGKGYVIDPLSSNSMKSANPNSGFHEEGVHQTLDTTAQNPTKNQGGTAIVQAAIGFDPSPRECLKRQFVELQTTLQNGTCAGFHNAVAIGCAMRGNRTEEDRGKLLETDGKEVAYSMTSAQADSMVALGIGRDMFNVGEGGQMSSALEELMPAQTARGGCSLHQ